MSAQSVAGWIAVGAGLALVATLLVSTIAPAAAGSPGASCPMGPGMMGGRGHMGGMKGFGNAGPASTAIPGATEVRVQTANFRFSPSEIRLPKDADVNLTLTNPAANGVVHDLTVPALGIHALANTGETRTIGLRGLAAGRYEAYCGTPGHADLGMRATVIVE